MCHGQNEGSTTMMNGCNKSEMQTTIGDRA